MALSLQHPSSISLAVPEIGKSLKSASFYQKGVMDNYVPSSFFSDLSMSNFNIPSLAMYLGVQSYAEIKPEQKIQGILGYNFFDNQVIQIDYRNNILRILKNNSYKNLFKNDSISSSKAVIRLNVSIQSPPDEKSYITTEDILVEGKKSKVLININGMFSTLADEKSNFRNVKIGEIEVSNARVLKTDSKKYDYVIEKDFLKNFVVTLNFKNNKLLIEKPL
jgi:hypothetical protein